MGDDITIGVTEIVNNIEVTAQPNDQIVDISVIDNADNVTLNITPSVIEINVNKGSSYAKWGTILGTLSDQTDLQNALDLKADLVDGKVPSTQLPSYVDDVIEVANYASLPTTGETGKIYITLDNNKVYRWSGSVYIEIAANSAIWGAITGTLTDQTDLVNALNLKVPYTGANSNVNLGEYGLTGGFLALDTTPTSTPTGIGTIYWDSANRTAALIDGDGDTTLQIGQEQRILVHNNTGSTLTDGQVVYVTGSTGNLPSVALASATIESTSAATIGVVTESIAHGTDGFITTSGIVNGLNTNAFNEGDLLWLGTTAGTFSTTKPISPNHLVLIGYVIKKAGGNGSILVKIQNTQELEESSDVLFSGLTNNDLLVYETASALWKNKSLATVLGYTPANDANVVHKTVDETIAGIKTFSDGLTSDKWYSQKIVASAYIPDSGYTNIFNNDRQISFVQKNVAGTAITQFSFVYPASNTTRAYNLPDSNGTFALTSQLHNAVTLGTANGLSLSTQVLSLGLASSSANGALSSTDWTTFNNKQNALSGTGFVKISGTTISYDNNTYALDSAVVKLTGNQTIAGVKTFSDRTDFSASGIKIGSTGWVTPNQVYGDGTDNFFINYSGGGHTIIGNSGKNVGIGTTSPSAKLDVNGSIYSNANILADYFKGYSGGDLTIDTNTSGAANLIFKTSLNERMRITSGGQVQISSPISDALKLTNTNSGAYNGVLIQNDASNQVVLGMGGSAVGGTNQNRGYSGTVSNVDYYLITNNTARLLVTSAGNVGIGTTSPSYTLHVNGSVAGTSAYVNLSDKRYKKDILPIENALDKILALNGVTFNWDKESTDMNLDDNNHIGLIAQDVEQIIPQAVVTAEDKNETKSVAYTDLVPVLIEAIKELKAEIEILKQK